MRLFIAIQLNEEMRRLTGDIQDDYRRMAVRGNYTPPENLHLTLAFIGEYDDPQQVLDALENVSYKPFRIRMDRTGCFDDLYWIVIEDDPHLENLVKQIRHALADAGIPFDKKRFRAHITFLRKAAIPRGGKVAPMKIEPADMLVGEFSLMCSTRGKHGMIYTELGVVSAENAK